jgi:hypothetical protein
MLDEIPTNKLGQGFSSTAGFVERKGAMLSLCKGLRRADDDPSGRLII